ncbi:MAG: amidohydrolase family protein [Eubacteriales bacterium]|nr:amidohydrolase family protein [Eubacteriales bacterium]
MTIIDTHVHIYPDAIALRAAASIGEFYDIPICMDGTLDTLLTHGRAAGISRFLVHSVATTWERVHSINDYLMKTVSQYPKELIGFGTMHPDFPDIPTELERMKAGGLHGVKLHPDIQTFLLDSDASIQMFRFFAEAGLPALVHMGDYRYPYSQPARMARVLDAVPGLRVICAHLGGWSVWDDAWKTLAKYDNVWVDTSSSLYALEPEEAVEIIHQYGEDKVFFGTDYPMWKPEEEIDRFLTLPLTLAERERILHGNFERFMGEA